MFGSTWCKRYCLPFSTTAILSHYNVEYFWLSWNKIANSFIKNGFNLFTFIFSYEKDRIFLLTFQNPKIFSGPQDLYGQPMFIRSQKRHFSFTGFLHVCILLQKLRLGSVLRISFFSFVEKFHIAKTFKLGNAAHSMFLEWWNSTKSLTSIWQHFSWLLM